MPLLANNSCELLLCVLCYVTRDGYLCVLAGTLVLLSVRSHVISFRLFRSLLLRYSSGKSLCGDVLQNIKKGM